MGFKNNVFYYGFCSYLTSDADVVRSSSDHRQIVCVGGVLSLVLVVACVRVCWAWHGSGSMCAHVGVLCASVCASVSIVVLPSDSVTMIYKCCLRSSVVTMIYQPTHIQPVAILEQAAPTVATVHYRIPSYNRHHSLTPYGAQDGYHAPQTPGSGAGGGASGGGTRY